MIFTDKECFQIDKKDRRLISYYRKIGKGFDQEIICLVTNQGYSGVNVKGEIF